MVDNPQSVNLAEWYSATAAAERLSRNSGKEISSSYPRKLAEYGKIRTLKISERNVLYSKEDIDNYIVEERGEKSGRAKRQTAKPKNKKNSKPKREAGAIAIKPSTSEKEPMAQERPWYLPEHEGKSTEDKSDPDAA